MNKVRMCAVGRTIARRDNFAGLDWLTPCTFPASRQLKVGKELYDFCELHDDVIIDHLARVFSTPEQPMGVAVVWEKQNQAYRCPCGELISVLDNNGFQLPLVAIKLLIQIHLDASDHGPFLAPAPDHTAHPESDQ